MRCALRFDKCCIKPQSVNWPFTRRWSALRLATGYSGMSLSQLFTIENKGTSIRETIYGSSAFIRSNVTLKWRGRKGCTSGGPFPDIQISDILPSSGDKPPPEWTED